MTSGRNEQTLDSAAELRCEHTCNPSTHTVTQSTRLCACLVARGPSPIRTVTVGAGITPAPALRLADYTADREFHPAPKILCCTRKYSIECMPCQIGHLAQFDKFPALGYTARRRGVAQSGSAQRLGRWGRWFESSHPDHNAGVAQLVERDSSKV